MTAQKYCICLDKETIECHIILVCVQRFQWQLFFFFLENTSVDKLTTGVHLYKINYFYLVGKCNCTVLTTTMLLLQILVFLFSRHKHSAAHTVHFCKEQVATILAFDMKHS